MEQEDLVTAVELAAILGTTARGVTERIRSGWTVPPPAMKRPYRWRRAEVDEWVELHRVVPRLPDSSTVSRPSAR